MEECIRMIGEKFNRGPSSQWTAYHFSLLSQEIFTKTGKTVSDSTLKRLFGKKDTSEHYTPQLYTRNAIAEYLDFKDWQELILYLRTSVFPGQQLPRKRKVKPAAYILIGICLVAVAVYFFTNGLNNATQVLLKTSDTLKVVPFTAVFHYDVSEFGDSVFIDFGNNTPVSLPKDKHSITEYYKACGVFYPKIFTRYKVLDSVRVQNLSTDWQGGYSPNDDYRMFIPFEDTAIFRQNGKLYISGENLKIQDPLYLKGIYAEYRLMKNFNIPLDSLSFSATVKNSPGEGGKLCFDVEIWLIGSNDNCKVRFVEPGCFRYGQLKVSEKQFNGRFDDLSALARDMKKWTDIRIDISGLEARVYYNGEKIISESYRNKLGKFLGIYIRCYGTGAVQRVFVHKDSQVVYRSNFQDFSKNFNKMNNQPEK